MNLKIDCHVHPCLPISDKKAVKKCNKWWKRIKELRLDGIIVSEHAYHNPGRAFEIMNRTKPDGMICIPGMEYITKEGIDINIFSNNKNIYSREKLKAFKLTFDEVSNLLVEDNTLYGYITHPNKLNANTVKSVFGDNFYWEVTNKLNAIEIACGGVRPLINILNKIPLRFLFTSLIQKLEKQMILPQNEYPTKIKFLAAGSDAHSLGVLGTIYLEIKCDGKNNFFNCLIENHGDVNYKLNKLNRMTIIDFLTEIYNGIIDYFDMHNGLKKNK